MIETTLFQIIAIILTSSIYIKTRHISKLSSHQGIRLINQAFLFFAISFTIAFLTSTSSLSVSKSAILYSLSQPIQTYFLTIAALYLSASLFWKNQKRDPSPLHIIALLITILNITTNILPLTLTAIYAYSSLTAYTNYTEKKTTFSQFYLIAITLLLTSNILQLLNFPFLISHSMIIAAFSIFLYGTLKTIK